MTAPLPTPDDVERLRGESPRWALWDLLGLHPAPGRSVSTTSPVTLRATTRQEADDEAFAGPLVVPVEHVLRLADPREGDPWRIGAFSDEDVWAQVGTPADPSACRHDEQPETLGCRTCELRRVAHFVVRGVDPLDRHPVDIDVGVGDFVPRWPISDGNHRLVAAAVRGDAFIAVEVAGDWDRAVSLLVDGRELADVLDETWV